MRALLRRLQNWPTQDAAEGRVLSRSIAQDVRRGILVTSLLIASACAGESETRATPDDRPTPSDLTLPATSDQILVAFDRDTLPAWRVESSTRPSELTRVLHVVQDCPVAIFLRADDRECRFSIPATRVSAVVPPDRMQSVWFTPLKPGTYDVMVSVGEQRCDGQLVVAPR
jgi:heme/copper-type cytochrome/quinol oxidase subunit 2